MTKAQKLNTISSTRVFLRGCIIALFVAALLTALPCPVQADMLLFWNFDEYTTEGGVNYVTDSVHSERLKLVNSSIVDGQLTSSGGYAQGTGTNNGTSVTLPTKTDSYTLSAFLTTTRNGSVGIMSWGVRGQTRQTNSFRTDGAGLKNYWWGDDLAIGGYPEVYSGSENYVVATGSGRTQTLYLNGQRIGTRDAGGDRNEQNRDFFVGNTINNNSETLYGTIDNASIYNDVMEHTDIVNIAAHTYNGLTNWWKAGETIDRVGGVVKPETVTGTTVITGTSGQTMVFNRTLTEGEQAYYQGQLAAEHDYVIDNMAGSASTKTMWLRESSANLNDAPETPLGIYVGGTTTASTLTATLDQINAVNRTLVMGGGTLALNLPGDATIDLNRINFNRGSLSLSGTGKMTIEPKQRLPLSNLAIPADNSVVFNTNEEVDIYGVLSGAGNLTKNGSGDLLFTSKSQSYSGVITLNGGSLTFGLQDAFGWADRAPYCSIVADNATITNNAAVFNALNNTTFKNGAKLIAADGQGTWKAFMLFGTTKVAFSGDGSTAENPVVFEVASTATGNARTNATICPYGTTFDVADITKSDAADLIVSAVLANTNGGGKVGSFTKTGAGTMELSGANTYTGTTTVSGGKLNITGSAFASRLIINNGASATIDAGETGVVNMDADGYNNSVMIGNGSSGSLTLESGNVTIHNSGSGTLGSIQLGTNSDTTVGTLTINGGSMQVDGRILIAANKTGAQATLTMNGGKLSLGVPEAYTTSGDPACGVLWFGAGTSTVNLNGGTVSMFGMNNNGPKAGSTFNFNGGTLQAVGDTTSFLTAAGSMQFYVKQGGAIIDTQSYNVTISAALLQGPEAGDAAGGLTKNGSGTLTLAAANTFSGDMTINAGTVVMAYNANTTSTTATPLGNPSIEGRKITVKSGATLETGGTDVFGGATAHPLFTLVADGGTIATRSGYLTSYGDIELKNNAVFDERGGHSTWYTIFNGDISVTSGNATIKSTNGKGISLRGYRNGTNAGVTFDVAKNSTLTVSALLRNSPNSGTVGSFTKKGEGTMILSNRSNDFTGNIVVDEGILKAQGGWAGGTSGTTVLGKNQARTITINKDGTLNFTAQDVVTNADNTTSIKFVVNGGTITNEGAVFNNLTNTEFYNGAKIVAANGHGTWKAFMLTGTNKVAFAGDGSKAESPVVFEVASTASGAALTNATICPYGATFEVADITKSDASDLVISAVLANTNGTGKIGSFTKTGAGTMELSAANTYDGTTTINAGTLKLTGDGSTGTGAVTIGESGTLEFAVENEKWYTSNAVSGTGTIRKTGGGVLYLNGTSEKPIASKSLLVEEGSLMFKGNYSGDLFVNEGTLLSPGNSVGDLIVEGAVTINGGATLLLEQDASGIDTLTATKFYISPDAIIDLAPSALQPGATYTLLTQTANELTDDYTLEFLTSLMSEEDKYYWNLSIVDHRLMATVDSNAVPEPSTWALLILGVGALMYWRKRNS
ncbi:MAG: autotransporter-associated beta strand repeat-containing protein [Thermoguttaceae bacterium]|nr:autotransporter-associated beta strand repeat-containing protein [Thermoguttaceae bacterium]